MAKINNRKLKAIGYFDLMSTISIIFFIFFLLIGLFNSQQENDKQLELSTELQPVEKVGRGYLGFYSSAMFLFFIGIYAVLSSCILIQASKLQKRQRKKQYLQIQYWVDNALEILIVMTMGWFFVLGEAIFNEDSKAIFTNYKAQLPYLLFYKVKIVCLAFVWTEYQKFNKEDMGLKDETWETWQVLLGFEIGAKEDIESGGSGQVAQVGGAQRMNGNRGRRNRQRARRNLERIDEHEAEV